jgi:uncharacterized lipoprotein YddW (UPF0748 family)
MASPLPRVIRMRITAGLFVCISAIVTLYSELPARRVLAQDAEVRALWVLRTSLESPEAIRRMVSSASANGFNTLFVQVRGRGDAYFNDGIELRALALARQPAGFDPLAETLKEAHARGLRVHAWVNINLVSSATALPPGRDHVIYEHPEWLMVPRELAPELAAIDPRSPEYLGRLARWTRANTARVEGLYVSPLHPDANLQTAAVVADLASRYAIDGVHFDYIRYPGADFDYSRAALDRFKADVRRGLSAPERTRVDQLEAADPFAYPDAFATEWRLFRQSQLTALVTRLRTSVRAARPAAIVSAAVAPDVDLALRDTLQDWRTWLDNGFLDALCPMAYTTEPAVFARQITNVLMLAGGKPVWAGIGAYRLSPQATIDNIAAARRLGTSGVVLFSYDSLISPPNGPEYLSTIARAAF